MNYWLFKSEPDTFSFERLKREGRTEWSGVRNFQARNNMLAMKVGVLGFFYHSSIPEPGIAGVMKTDRIVSGTGELVSTAADSTIQAFGSAGTASIVQAINVHAGELVTKGQVLATLNPTYAAADLTALTQQEQGYAAQVAQLQAQEDGKPYEGDPANPQFFDPTNGDPDD